MIRADDVRFTLDRLDMDHVLGCAREARQAWDDGQPSWEIGYMPGDATHYALVFTVLGPWMPVYSAPGGGSNGMTVYSGTGCKFDGQTAMVTYVQRERSAFFHRLDFAEPGWVEERLSDNRASAIALAVLLNEISGAAPGWGDKWVERLREAEAATAGVES